MANDCLRVVHFMVSERALRSLSARRAYREIVRHVIVEAVAKFEPSQSEKEHFRKAAIFHNDVLNGGLFQYFTNSSGREYRETLISLAIIGAMEQRVILERCVALLSSNVNLEDRNKVGLYVCTNEHVKVALQALDKEYFTHSQTFYGVMIDFALAHKPTFGII